MPEFMAFLDRSAGIKLHALVRISQMIKIQRLDLLTVTGGFSSQVLSLTYQP